MIGRSIDLRIWIRVAVDRYGIRKSNLIECQSLLQHSCHLTHLSWLIDVQHVTCVAPAIWVRKYIAIIIDTTWTIFLPESDH